MRRGKFFPRSRLASHSFNSFLGRLAADVSERSDHWKALALLLLVLVTVTRQEGVLNGFATLLFQLLRGHHVVKNELCQTQAGDEWNGITTYHLNTYNCIILR